MFVKDLTLCLLYYCHRKSARRDDIPPLLLSWLERLPHRHGNWMTVEIARRERNITTSTSTARSTRSIASVGRSLRWVMCVNYLGSWGILHPAGVGSVDSKRFQYTVEPPITDPPTSGQPLYNGHWLWHQLKLL